MPETVIFDHYQVLTRDDGSLFELGRGAMGITYKAFDTNLRVPVALKVINTATLNSEVARQRFVQEARSAAKLRNRHVASVFHLGSGGDTYFYAMEFIDGETIEALIRRQGPLSPDVALRIALQVARALSAAQQHGLVHRDIKPSNLMLVKEDDELVVKVIDFGLAKTCIPDEGDEDAASLSMGGFVGTPHFASPEQLEDRATDVRSDIYSLGVTTWYMLAGHTPFSGSLAVVMSQHLTKAPPFERLREVPEAVLALLKKMLAKDPAERQQNAAELRQEIENCLATISGGAGVSTAIAANDENFATLLDDSKLRSTSADFETGAVIADRYKITRTLGDSNTGRLFIAQDRSRNSLVRLHVLRQEFAEDHALYTQLEREVERLSTIEHPNLFRVYALESLPDASFLVLEATTGFSLMELLRARRELPIEEVLPLLEQIAKGVDFALTSGLRRLDLALHQIHVHFPGVTDAAPLLREPVTQWPAFELKVSPLGITRELAASETWAGGETLVGGSAPTSRLGGADARTNYIKAFATVTYELLGGTLLPVGIPGLSTARYSPLAPLTEGGNDVVRQGLQTGNYPDAANFAEMLRTAEAAEARRREGPSPYKTTTTPLPADAGVAAPVTQPTKRPIPLGFFGGILSVVAVGGLLYFFMRDAAPPRTGAPPATHSLPSTPASPPATPSPVPSTPEPTPQPTRQDLLKVAVTGAETLEAGGDWKRAISAWLRVIKTYPESEIGRVRLEMLLQMLHKRPENLNTQELEQLRDLITEAAHADVLAAMMLLGKALRDREPTTAFNWYSAAAAKGNAAAYTQLGLMLSNGEGVEKADLAKSIICFQLAVEMDDAAAKTSLAECYLYGKGIAKDEARAIALLKEAAAQENVRAMDRLGTCYHKGIGVERNFAEAVRLFSAAAERGYSVAMGNLGVLYINGEGVPTNPVRAVELFEKGTKLNDGYCMFLYARCLESDTGVAKDLLKARAWYLKAAEAGYADAINWCRKNGVPVPVKGQ